MVNGVEETQREAAAAASASNDEAMMPIARPRRGRRNAPPIEGG